MIYTHTHTHTHRLVVGWSWIITVGLLKTMHMTNKQEVRGWMLRPVLASFRKCLRCIVVHSAHCMEGHLVQYSGLGHYSCMAGCDVCIASCLLCLATQPPPDLSCGFSHCYLWHLTEAQGHAPYCDHLYS